MAERITVSGFRKPQSPATRRDGGARVPLVQPRSLIWLGVLAALPCGAALWGKPTMLISTTSVGPYSTRTYVDCRYLGFDDTRVVFPRHGRCPFIRLLKPDHRS